MITYTIFIRDQVKDFSSGQNGVETRHVLIRGLPGSYELGGYYPPNGSTKPFNYNGPFDTSASIVPSLYHLARELVGSHSRQAQEKKLRFEDLELKILFSTPTRRIVKEGKNLVEYGFNEDQQRLFANILTQKLEKVKLESKQATRTYGALPPPGREHEIGMTVAEILAKRKG